MKPIGPPSFRQFTPLVSSSFLSSFSIKLITKTSDLPIDQMDDNSTISTLRAEIASRASTALQLCSIHENSTISPHWRLFSPICELIQASVNDEKTIPHFLARIDGKVSDMRRRLDPSILDEVIALNILQMFSGFVKFMKTLSHMDPSGTSPAEMNGEIERLKTELFNRETEYETLKREFDAIRMGGEHLRDQFNSIFGMDYEEEKVKLVIPKSKNITQSSPMKRGKRNTQMVRTVTTTDYLPPIPPPPPFPSPFSSLLNPSSTPHYVDSPLSTETILTLRNILGTNYNGPTDERTNEIEQKKDTKRRRPIESPLYGKEEEEEDGNETKRSCGDNIRNITHGGEREDYPCPFENCGRTFNKISTLFEHTTSDHYSEGAMQLQCSSCREYYDREKSFETHTLNCPIAEPIMTMKRWDHDEETNDERLDRLELEKKLQSCPYPGCSYVSKSKSRSIFKHMNKSHGNDGRAWYKCTCGMKRRTLYTMLFHRYAECRTGNIEWLIDSPALLKTEDWNDDGSMVGTSNG